MGDTGRMFGPTAMLSMLSMLCASVAMGDAPPDASRVDFSREVRPILAAKCFACHGPDAEARRGGLRLDSFEGATATLKSGVRAIVPSDVAASALIARVTHADPSMRMPADGHEALTAAQVETLSRWIASGARYQAPWAFQPLTTPMIPAVNDAAWCASDIDRFVLATRESNALAAPALDADASTLLRRLSFDLRGLPPDEADVRAFAADSSDAQFAALVDRYLADPAYGERWGRHWLDLMRYAETLAHEFDYAIPHAWRYRDYVIDAFNSDVPPARFVSEHIAGDLLSPRAALGLQNAAALGTGWWFLGPATHAPVDVRQDEADRIAGTVDVAGRALFGLSIACARCHDHKFDPIPASDFYALAGVARNTRRVVGFLDSDARMSPLAHAAAQALRDGAAAARVQKSTRERVDAVAAVDAAPSLFHDDLIDNGAHWQRSGDAFVSDQPLTTRVDGGHGDEHGDEHGDGIGATSMHAAQCGTIDSGRVDRALVGSARSDTFVVAQRWLHVRVRGDKSALRVIIDNYWLDESNGLLFDGMRRDVNAPQDSTKLHDLPWQTLTFDLLRFLDERAYVELVDGGAGAIEVDWIALSASDVAPDASWDVDDVAIVIDAGASSLDETRTAQVRTAMERHAELSAQLAQCSAPVRALIAEDGNGFDEPLHRRGSSRAYGEDVPRAQLAIMGNTPIATPMRGSGRAELASRITDPAQPFLWRTLANRVWLKLFGRGIVETPDDFGQLGATPWSEGLLDHLAHKLAHGATFKSLIREVVLSHAYRAAAETGEFPATAWHALPVRRLDAESIRDAMLASSGRLDRASGGPSIAARLTDHMQGRGRPEQSGPVDGAGRRSVYLETRRNFLDPFLQAFDQPAPSTTCGKRHTSNVPAQSLALLNSELSHVLATQWSQSVLAPTSDDDDARVEHMWFAAFSRAPRDEELLAARAFLAAERAADSSNEANAHAYAALAHALFSAKEFVFLR